MDANNESYIVVTLPVSLWFSKYFEKRRGLIYSSSSELKLSIKSSSTTRSLNVLLKPNVSWKSVYNGALSSVHRKLYGVLFDIKCPDELNICVSLFKNGITW